MRISLSTIFYLHSVNKDLEIELRDVRTAQDSKFQTMRAAISSADLKAEGEREERRSIEEKMFRMKLDYDDDYEVSPKHAFNERHIRAHTSLFFNPLYSLFFLLQSSLYTFHAHAYSHTFHTHIKLTHTIHMHIFYVHIPPHP